MKYGTATTLSGNKQPANAETELSRDTLPARSENTPIDWKEFWRVIKPIMNVWITVYWLLMVMPNIMVLNGFIEVMREFPLIMVSFFLSGTSWMFYMLGKDWRMVWCWVVNISVAIWIT